MSTPFLNLIGVGADGVGELAPTPARLLQNAGVIVTSKRLAAGLEGVKAEIHTWPSPFDPMIDQIRAWQDRNPVVLATGEPLWFGIGAALLRAFTPSDVAVWPATGAFSLAAARLGWPLEDTVCLSLHGRSVETLIASLSPGAKLLCLTTNGETVLQVAELLASKGFGSATLHVLEAMATPHEKHTSFVASSSPDTVFNPFNTVAIECRPDGPVVARATAFGLPDETFYHDGQLTKQAVRAVTLAKLAAAPGPLLWDIGAGNGSIAIEWLRLARHHSAVAFEHDERRTANIELNAANLGVPHLKVVPGKVPHTLDKRSDRPDAVFIGGGLTAPGVAEAVLAALRPGGVMVANAVSVEGRTALLDLASRMSKEHETKLEEIAISSQSSIGNMTVLKPALPVLQLSMEKP